MDFQFYLGNDNLIFLGKTDPLTNQKTAAVVSDATVTVRIVDTDGVAVPGITWPVAMPPVAGSPGVYCTTIDKAIEVEKDTSYIAEITALATGAIDAFWRIPFIARERNK